MFCRDDNPSLDAPLGRICVSYVKTGLLSCTHYKKSNHATNNCNPPADDFVGEGLACAGVAAGMQVAFSVARFSRALVKPG